VVATKYPQREYLFRVNSNGSVAVDPSTRLPLLSTRWKDWFAQLDTMVSAVSDTEQGEDTTTGQNLFPTVEDAEFDYPVPEPREDVEPCECSTALIEFFKNKIEDLEALECGVPEYEDLRSKIQELEAVIDLVESFAALSQAGVVFTDQTISQTIGTSLLRLTKLWTTDLEASGTTKLGDGATNFTQFDSTGHQKMYGTARPWRDALGELLTKKTVGLRITDNAVEGTSDYADNCVAADDYKITNLQLNHDKDLTSDIHPHIHWFQSSANVPNWLLQYRWQVNGAAKVTAWTDLKCNTAVYVYTAGTILQKCTSAAIAVPVGTSLSDIVQFRVCRDTANVSTLFAGADPLAGDAAALSFDCHLQMNSIGSDDEYTK